MRSDLEARPEAARVRESVNLTGQFAAAEEILTGRESNDSGGVLPRCSIHGRDLTFGYGNCRIG
jgi:hypothetical protein